MIIDRFYYFRLNEYEKKIYMHLYQGVKDLQREIRFPVDFPLSRGVMENAFRALTLDNPLFYYLDPVRLKYSQDSGIVTVWPTYFLYRTQVDENDHKVQQWMNRILGKIDIYHMSELEREFRIHDYLCAGDSYEPEYKDKGFRERAEAAGSVVEIMKKNRAVSEGTAKAVKLLLNMANIRCSVVNGHSAMNGGGGHAWNIVRIDGKAYHLDVTWDAGSSNKGHICYDYFNLPDDMIGLDHEKWSAGQKCTSWDANYFVVSGNFFRGTEELKEAVSPALSRGVRSFSFRIWDPQKPMHEVMTGLSRFMLRELGEEAKGLRTEFSYSEEQKTGYIRLVSAE